jgi:tRNA threonylcarbamoyladenosine biosynthesis protein TsaE
MHHIQLELASETETLRLGRVLAQHLPAGATVCLMGTLGAGKTRLVQAVAAAYGIERDRVVSPTFTLCNEYRGAPGISHWDLYRVADEDELMELGIEEYFASPDLTFVEWADRFPDSLPPERYEVELAVTGPSSRDVQIRAYGPVYEATLERLHQAWLAQPV